MPDFFKKTYLISVLLYPNVKGDAVELTNHLFPGA